MSKSRNHHNQSSGDMSISHVFVPVCQPPAGATTFTVADEEPPLNFIESGTFPVLVRVTPNLVDWPTINSHSRLGRITVNLTLQMCEMLPGKCPALTQNTNTGSQNLNMKLY